MTLRQEDTGEIKYEVRSTKYEVKELGATELRRGVGRRQSRNDAWESNLCTCDVAPPLVRRASATRTGTSMATVSENFIGTDVHSYSLPSYIDFFCGNSVNVIDKSLHRVYSTPQRGELLLPTPRLGRG